MKHILLYTSIIFNILTNIGFNLSALNEQTPVKKWTYFFIGLGFGLANSYLFMECLKYFPLQIASAVFFSLTIVGLVLAGFFMFKETITPFQAVGMLLILVGVVMVSLKDVSALKMSGV